MVMDSRKVLGREERGRAFRLDCRLDLRVRKMVCPPQRWERVSQRIPAPRCVVWTRRGGLLGSEGEPTSIRYSGLLESLAEAAMAAKAAQDGWFAEQSESQDCMSVNMASELVEVLHPAGPGVDRIGSSVCISIFTGFSPSALFSSSATR